MGGPFLRKGKIRNQSTKVPEFTETGDDEESENPERGGVERWHGYCQHGHTHFYYGSLESHLTQGDGGGRGEGGIEKIK